MKLLKNIILLAAVALFASCETDVDTPQIYSPDQFVAPVIGECRDVIVNADNSATETVIFTWKPADFGQQVQILYSVYLVSGEKSVLLGTSASTSFTIAKGDLNGSVINGLSVAPNATADVTAYVTAQLAGTTAYEPMKSNNSNSFQVTTYAAPLKKLYVVGFFNGWDAAGAVEVWETGAGTNVFEGLYNFTEDATNTPGLSGFKFLPVLGSWDNAIGYNECKAWGASVTSSSDGNLVVPAGIWKVSLNRTAQSIDAKAVSKVGIIGTFNDWNEGTEGVLTYSIAENAWISEPLAFGADGEFLIRMNGNWDNKCGASGNASIAIPGGLELVTNGGDNIKITAGAGTYVAKLHADRTPLVIELIKQ